jgi:cyclopropane-fatty-acyl-phospholipid synthase
MRTAIRLAERGLLPDRLIRIGIRKLLRHRLRQIDPGDCQAQERAKMTFIEQMRSSPVALHTEEANEQHYELPPAFFEKVLGKRLKYSSCYYDDSATTLDQAEEAMLALSCERAELENGQEVLELGCGWGSLTLWMAEKYPDSRITAVSNSSLQREFIEGQCRERGLENVQVVTADVNEFATDLRFDRVVSVEMFEHLRNYQVALERVAGWLKADGKVFIHVFCHRDSPYIFEAQSDDDWMGKYFFTGGLMPSDDLFLYFQRDLVVEEHWRVEGTHYERTARGWLENMDAHREDILPILSKQYGEKGEMWFQRWRMFFLACEELFGYAEGQEWWVTHYRFGKRQLNGKDCIEARD